MLTPVELKTEMVVADGHALLTLSGEIDIYTAAQLREQLSDVLGQVAHVVVDLAAVEFADSTGLGVLVAALKRCRHNGGDLVLRAPSQSLAKALEVTGLNQVFTFAS